MTIGGAEGKGDASGVYHLVSICDRVDSCLLRAAFQTKLIGKFTIAKCVCTSVVQEGISGGGRTIPCSDNYWDNVQRDLGFCGVGPR